jgi:hypothetical protein
MYIFKKAKKLHHKERLIKRVQGNFLGILEINDSRLGWQISVKPGINN